MERTPLSGSTSQMTSWTVTLSGAANVIPRWWHSSTSYLGSESVKLTNSREAVSLKSLIGKTDLKTACRPWSLRASGATSFCRNSSYERFWISIRFGMSMIFLIRPNVRRKRRLFGTRDTIDGMVLIAFLPVPSLQLHASAGVFELLLDRLGLGLRHGFLHRLRGAVDEVLRLLQAEPRDLAHHLDDLDLLVARAGQDDGEVLLLRRRRG